MVDMQFDYARLQQMAGYLMKGAQQLEDTKSQIARIAHGFNGGSFEGLAGEAFAAGLAQQLNQSMDRLIAKYREMAKDIQDAAQTMQEYDSRAAGQF